jgi:hypothetical protein
MLKKNITTLNEFEGAALLKQWGIPVIDGVLANHDQEATVAANRLGFPVALKICSGEVPHKTERGGVVLNIQDAASLEKAVLALLQRLKGAVLLNGYRAQKPMDIISIAGAIAAEQPGRLTTFTKASPRWACPATPRRSAPSLPLAAWWNTPGSAA